MILTRRSIAPLMLAFFAMISPAAGAQTHPNFSGTWRQSNDQSTPKRSGDVTLKIDHQDPSLTIETTSRRRTSPAKHVVQRYTTEGKVSISTGIDGDEFHTSVTWIGDSLAFSIEEHEDGRVIHSKEIWSLARNGELKRVRENSEEGKSQTILYLRQN